MHLCVENIQDPEVVSPESGNALPDPPEANSIEEGPSREQSGPEPRETSGGLARWFGFKRSRTSKIPNIVHVNLEGFFASVEQVLNRKLRRKPVLVGPGIVASASYEAKLCSVKIGMTFPDALRICPTAITVSGEYDAYADFAERVRGILESHTSAVESGSQDDFFLDFAGGARRYPDYPGTLRRMQCEILGRTGLSVSIGAGRSKVVAATASQLQLPSGLRVVVPGEEEAFLAPLPAEKIYGIGPVYGATLVEHGVATVGELCQVPKPALQALFGEAIGKQIWERARGLDGKGLPERASAEFISRETTVEGSGVDREFFATLIRYLGKRVSSALRENGKQAHAVGLRVRYVNDFSAHESVRIHATSDEGKILDAANELFTKLWTRGLPLRLISVTTKCVDDCKRLGELESKEATDHAYPGDGVNSVNGDYGWNVSRAFG
jgi:DNA polymerase IV